MALVVKCDGCPSIDKVVQYSLIVGRSRDAATNMTDDYETMDLCGPCANKVLRMLIDRNNTRSYYDTNREWIQLALNR